MALLFVVFLAHFATKLTWHVADRMWVYETRLTVKQVLSEPPDPCNHVVIVDEAQNLSMQTLQARQ